jgi:two-component system, NarL family, invasion response regulator UvrY
MLRILIVDDHLLIRCGLKQILSTEFGNELEVGEAQNSREAIEQLAAKKWNVVVVDINLPGRSGLVLLHDIKAMYPKLPVLVLTACSEQEFAVRVLRAGASGFIAKESTHLELVQAIKKVVAGGKHVSSSVSDMLVEQITSPVRETPHETLSDREYQVMCMLGQGKTPTEIAKELTVSVKSISTYRSRILQKLNIRTNAQIVHYTVRHQLVSL